METPMPPRFSTPDSIQLTFFLGGGLVLEILFFLSFFYLCFHFFHSLLVFFMFLRFDGFPLFFIGFPGFQVLRTKKMIKSKN